MTAHQPIGRIILETPDGRAHATALYDLPMLLREAELYLPDGVYRQQRQTDTGQHVYRWSRPLVGPPNRHVKDYKHPGETDWDGPARPVPIATVEQVDAAFQAALTEASETATVPVAHVLALYNLTMAAWYHLPVPA